MYNPQEIETKWLDLWEQWQLFQQTERGDDLGLSKADGTVGSREDSRLDVRHEVKKSDNFKEKIYLLFAFAYPSGSGLHVGHAESKTALDILARYHRMNGKEVFFPVGWDAFGLPAENYAIKTGVPPAETTKNAITTFRRQIKRLAISYDWANEIATCHPGYYKWTQWLFLQLLAKDLAYKKVGFVNWCSSCQTVLANEQVVNGECERCGTQVTQKEMDQWFFRITEYQDELISGLEDVDWPHATKQQQLNWIGKKTGVEITYQVVDGEGNKPEFATDGREKDAPVFESITCFTTRPETNFGATFVVLAPEHAFSKQVAKSSGEVGAKVVAYLEQTSTKTELERQQDGKKKTGVFTDFYALNPLNNSRMPIWISDFVLGGFGTGAVVGVPGHDTRDFEFTQTFDIPVARVVVGREGETTPIVQVSQVHEEAGVMMNSAFLDGLDTAIALEKMADYLEEKGFGRRVTTYRLRDWLISRQRYWGAPIPVIYDPEGTAHPIVEAALPWELPIDVDYNPKGISPLASSKEFLERTENYAAHYHPELIAQKGWDASGKGWRPEFDTMDTFVDSSWYYLRYLDARNETAFADKAQLDRWLPVDFYMIGPEHIVLHLLYSRFFTKFLRDEGYLKINEPFSKMRHQGMILGPDHRKMSKSKGNVINPDDIIEKFGADTLRVYEMFMGPIEADKPWDTRSVVGVYKFLQRVNDLVEQHCISQDAGTTSVNGAESSQEKMQYDDSVRRKLHQTIKKVSTDITQLKFNTAIASMMECLNSWEKSYRAASKSVVPVSDVLAWVGILAPFAPFMSEELYHKIKSSVSQVEENITASNSVHLSTWPEYDPSLLTEETVQIPVQVNGKVRAQLEVNSADIANATAVLERAKQSAVVKTWLEGKEIVKEIYIPGKIVNFAVKG